MLNVLSIMSILSKRSAHSAQCDEHTERPLLNLLSVVSTLSGFLSPCSVSWAPWAWCLLRPPLVVLITVFQPRAVTLGPFLKVFVPKIEPSSFMPRTRVAKLSSTIRRRRAVQEFGPCDLGMRPCSNCEKAGRPSQCKLKERSNKCLKCVRLGQGCNLAPFDPTK